MEGRVPGRRVLKAGQASQVDTDAAIERTEVWHHCLVVASVSYGLDLQDLLGDFGSPAPATAAGTAAPAVSLVAFLDWFQFPYPGHVIADLQQRL